MTDQIGRKPTERLADEAIAQLAKVVSVVRSLVGESFFMGWLEHQMGASRASLGKQLSAAGLGQHVSLLNQSVLGADDFVQAEGDAWADFYRSELERIMALKGQELMGAAAIAAQALKATMDKNSLTIRQAGLHQPEEHATH